MNQSNHEWSNRRYTCAGEEWLPRQIQVDNLLTQEKWLVKGNRWVKVGKTVTLSVEQGRADQGPEVRTVDVVQSRS